MLCAIRAKTYPPRASRPMTKSWEPALPPASPPAAGNTSSVMLFLFGVAFVWRIEDSHWYIPIHSPPKGMAATTAATSSALGAGRKASQCSSPKTSTSTIETLAEMQGPKRSIHTSANHQVAYLRRNQHANPEAAR